MKSLQILEKLVGFNTVDDQENEGVMKYLANLLEPAGFKIQLVKNKVSKKINLLAKYNQGKKPVLTFSGHTDTVPATKSWSQNPLSLTLKGDKLYGLGTGDMKGPMAAFISAALNSDLKKLRKGLNLVFTYGEEVDLAGIQDFLKKVKLKTKLVIVGEDTALVPVAASKGAYAVKIEFQGKEAHGAEINKGINAILIAQQFISRLDKYFQTLQKKTNQVFEIPFATVNVAKVMGGDLINRIPAYCCLEFEYRTITDQQGVKIYQDILEILRQQNCQFRIKLTSQIEPMLIQNKKFAVDLENLTGNKAIGCNGATEGSFYSKYGYDCLVLGPGNGLAHQPNEYITKEQLVKGEKMYRQIIAKYCA